MDWGQMEEFISVEKDFIEESCLFNEDNLSDRIKKTFYYSPHKQPMQDTLSFSITKEAVASFRKAAPSPFGKLGHRYASRVARDACISPCSLLLGMIYIERLAHRNPDYLQKISSSDLFLITMMIASKYLQDEGVQDEVFNDEWAASGLLDVDYVNSLEAEFLSAIDWRVLIRRGEFQRMLHNAETRIAGSHAFARGWLSYTDLMCLMQNNKWKEVLHDNLTFLVKAACVCIFMYGGILATSAVAVFALHGSMRHSIKFGPLPSTTTVSETKTTGPVCNDTSTVTVTDQHPNLPTPGELHPSNQFISSDTGSLLDVAKVPRPQPQYTQSVMEPASKAKKDTESSSNSHLQAFAVMETICFLANLSEFENSYHDLKQDSPCSSCYKNQKKYFHGLPADQQKLKIDKKVSFGFKKNLVRGSYWKNRLPSNKNPWLPSGHRISNPLNFIKPSTVYNHDFTQSIPNIV